jgi:agmatine deiminase
MPPTPTPAELGYRMPAEWSPHRATWVAWPHQRDDWPDKFEPVPWVYVEIVRHLHRAERVRLIVADGQEDEARGMLGRAGVVLDRVDFLHFATDRVWLRDSGAILLQHPEGKLAATDWHFNAWAKYDNWHNDDKIAGLMAAWLKVPSWQPTIDGRRVVLEGGSIDVDGEGLLVTTEECLLDTVQARNPGVTREQLERVLADHLGVRRVIWLNKGIAGDDTHGHVDDITRFVAPRAVVTAIEPDRGDYNHEPLRENLERLRAFRDEQGRGLEIVELPMPAPLVFDGQRLPASYANFYIANGRVLVPTFNDPMDRHALNVLAGVFPGREVVGIHAVDLVWGLGTLHCLSQQEPV